MTQENETSIPSGVATPEKAPAKAKKTTARKTPGEKAPEKKVPAAKTTAKATAVAKQTAAEKSSSTKTEKTASAAKKTAATKKPVAKKAADATALAEKPAAKKSTAKAPKAKTPEKAPDKPSAAKKDAAKKNTPKSAAKKAEPALPEAPVAAAPAAVAESSAPGEAEQKSETPRPSSRRFRRGGRRRNKKPAQSPVEELSAKDTTAPEINVPEMQEPEAEPVSTKQPENKPRKNVKPEGKPGKDAAAAKKEASPKGGSKKAEPEAETEPTKTSSGKRKIFISILSGELVEVVLAEEGQVQEYYVEMQHQAKVKGNIYKGVVSNIDANLQAAFVSYAGGVKNGFLQIDEVHPEYYVADHDPAKGRKYPPIQKVLKPGQEILVQVVKEPAGTKGAFLTSYLSLPGRFLVLTPGREQIGVSRKVENDSERARLRTIIDGLSVGAGLGVIVRTVSSDASKTSLSRDLQFLKRLWKEVRTKGQTQPSPSLIYEELDLSTRAIRDYLTDDVQEVWVDDEATGKQVAELASLLFPKKRNLVQIHHDAGHSLFERFSMQKQLDQIHSREVSLPSGGRLAIDNTEALTAIDINSGRSSGKTNFEDMAFRANLEAAKSIPLQLRLRDIGGQVVIDFIEMRDRDHWREVEKAVRSGMKGDRARYDVGKIGPFGLLEIVRQRLGSSAISVSTEPCPCCKGTGIRRNMEWQAMQSLRDISRALRQAAANNQTTLTYPTETELALYLLNSKRSILQRMEEESGVTLAVRPAGE
jgi:ribonuclease E